MELTWSSHQLRDSIYTCSLAQEAWKSFGRMERKAHNPWESGAKLLSLWGTPWNQWWRFLHDTSLWYLCASYSACVLDQAPSRVASYMLNECSYVQQICVTFFSCKGGKMECWGSGCFIARTTCSTPCLFPNCLRCNNLSLKIPHSPHTTANWVPDVSQGI